MMSCFEIFHSINTMALKESAPLENHVHGPWMVPVGIVSAMEEYSGCGNLRLTLPRVVRAQEVENRG